MCKAVGSFWVAGGLAPPPGAHGEGQKEFCWSLAPGEGALDLLLLLPCCCRHRERAEEGMDLRLGLTKG